MITESGGKVKETAERKMTPCFYGKRHILKLCKIPAKIYIWDFNFSMAYAMM